AEIIIAKQRNGPTGTIKLAFIKEITKFENLAKDYFHSLDDEPPKNLKKDVEEHKEKVENNTLTDIVEDDLPFNLEEEDIVDL
ncbi:MAG: replicative DNA helicase, partial [Aquificota bacterium]